MQMKEIPLTQGLVALVDDEDYEELMQYKWHACKHKYTYYAFRNHQVYPGYRISVRMHRQIMRAQANEIIDHINGNGLDNRKENLRIVSSSQNAANRRAHAGSKSRFKGVSWHKQHGKWAAYICYNYKHKHIGLFRDEIEAAIAYDRKAIELFGEYARTNFPLENYKDLIEKLKLTRTR